MASSSMSLGTIAARPTIRHRQSATLIPVTLRILDDSGRHRITEPIVGILTHISSDEFRVSVTGPAGRPFSRSLGRRRKIQLRFINDELHEMIEGLVCDHIETKNYQPRGDAQVVRLSVPQLPAQLFDEIFAALKRYAPPETKRYAGYIFGILILAAAISGFMYYENSSRPQTYRRPTLGSAQMRQQVVVLSETVDSLASQLQEADLEIETLRHKLISSSTSSIASNDQRGGHRNEQAIAHRSQLFKKAYSPQRVRLRGASWEDFQHIRSIRGTQPSPQLGFGGGDIEITKLSQEHHQATSMLTRLLSTFALSKGLDLRAVGSISLESTDHLVSIEPDAVFIIGLETSNKPSVVFQHCRPSEKKALLERYRTIGIAEIWLRSENKLEVFSLISNNYEQQEASVAMPELDIGVLASFLERSDQTAATREFIASLAAN